MKPKKGPQKTTRVPVKQRTSHQHASIERFQSFLSKTTSRESRVFWDQVVKFADEEQFSVSDLVVKFQEEAESRKKRGRKGRNEVNHIRILIESLFNIESDLEREKIRENLTMAAKTKTWKDMLGLIRNKLDVTGLGRNIVPSVRTNQKEGHLIMQ